MGLIKLDWFEIDRAGIERDFGGGGFDVDISQRRVAEEVALINCEKRTREHYAARDKAEAANAAKQEDRDNGNNR